MKKITIISLLALIVVVVAPTWAALAGVAGLMTGPVALICAGLYVANGSQIKNALKMTLGFLAGNFWAFFVVLTLGALGPKLGLPEPLLLWLVLAVYVAIAVLIAGMLDTIFDLSAWLAGWAVTLQLLVMVAPSGANLLTWVIQIGIAMVAGVWVVGVLITQLHGKILGKLSSKN